MSRLPYVTSTVEVGRSQQRIMGMFRRFKVDSFSFHEKPGAGEFIVQFQYKGLPVSLPFSSEGALKAYLQAEPWSPAGAVLPSSTRRTCATRRTAPSIGWPRTG